MELKTKVHAETGKQTLTITREFDLPVELLFKAYTQADLLEQWMGTKVLKLDSQKHGSYQFETTDAAGNVVFKAHGVIHELVLNQKMIRTFEIENVAFPIQLEFLTFEQITADTAQLTIVIVYKTVAERDQVLKLPFAHGLSMAHNRLQEIIHQLK
jgi:uncharacterized protein YndB with AHSA1/START domain